MDGHVAKNNESTFPSFVDLDDFLNKHNSNFIWLLVGKSVSSLHTMQGHQKCRIEEYREKGRERYTKKERERERERQWCHYRFR